MYVCMCVCMYVCVCFVVVVVVVGISIICLVIHIFLWMRYYMTAIMCDVCYMCGVVVCMFTPLEVLI